MERPCRRILYISSNIDSAFVCRGEKGAELKRKKFPTLICSEDLWVVTERMKVTSMYSVYSTRDNVDLATRQETILRPDQLNAVFVDYFTTVIIL